jgi:methylamine dehydrogenase heavy chain
LRSFALIVALLATVLAAPAFADVQAEAVGQIESLPHPPRPHWVWVADLILERAALIDLDEGRFLGMINAGYGPFLPLFSAKRSEIYIPATYYSRRWRGERTDVLEIHDSRTLSFAAEVVLPPRKATNAVALGHAALSDDERFVAVFNWTTGTSLSIVDVERRVLAGEIVTPGCSLVYAAGPRRFFSLCGDGSLFSVMLDDDGKEANRTRSKPFFDPRADPVTEKAVRYGDQWLFVSFEGQVYPVDVSGEGIHFGEAWSLLDDADRKESWRVGGMQHLAMHERSGRLYSLVHRGGPGTHKDPGEEVWIYDVPSRKRIERLKLVNPGLTIYGFPIEIGRGWIWPFEGLSAWAFDTFAPPAVSHIQVTQDEKPLLFTASQYSGSLAVYDGLDNRFLRRVQPTGWTSDVLVAPWGGVGR